jgi:hypothetical protein
MRSLVAGLVIALSAAAQPADDSRLKKLRELGLPEAPGSMPVIYVASAKDRALRFQKSLEAAQSWYEKQLKVRVPIVLAVLDPETQGKISDRTLMPHNFFWGMPGAAQGLVVTPATATGPPSAVHPEFLQHEPAAFHEVGHIIAYQLNIWSGNQFVNEIVAQTFAEAYMKAERPDLNWVLDNLRDGRTTQALQTAARYTSLADLDYLYTAMGEPNYVWFQQAGLGRLAYFLVTDQSFPAVIEKLQKAFPATEAKQETIEVISRHLEGVRPGFLKEAGSLAGPTTIPSISPWACPELTKGGGRSYLVVRNNTADSLTLTNLDGPNSLSIAAHSWRTFNVRVGALLKLRDGTCLVARDEPSLAVIDRQ